MLVSPSPVGKRDHDLPAEEYFLSWDFFFAWNYSLVSLAVTSPGSVFPVLGLLIGAVSWGVDQYGGKSARLSSHGSYRSPQKYTQKYTEMRKKKLQTTADMLCQSGNDDWWLYR